MIINKMIEKDRELEPYIENDNDPLVFDSLNNMWEHWEYMEARRGIVEKIMDLFYFNIWGRLKDFRYYLKNRYIRKHHMVDTGLKAGEWYDTDHRMLYANMALFEQFIKNEDPFGTVDYKRGGDEYKEVYKKMKKIEKWWNNYEKRLKDIDIARDLWYDNCKSEKGDVKSLRKLTSMEVKLNKEEQEMLHMLIDIRNFLWT